MIAEKYFMMHTLKIFFIIHQMGKNICLIMYLHMICSIFVAKQDMKDMQPPRNRNMITNALLVKTDLRVPM